MSKLLLDQANSRLTEIQPDQESTYRALARVAGDHVVALAEDIVERGLDPLTVPAVVADPEVANHYKVLEGNRRTLALKALHDPRIVDGALPPAKLRKLRGLSERFLESPINSVTCVLFATEDDAWPWIERRHTGANNGTGLVEWGADEKDRFKSRHGSDAKRAPAGQVIDFVDRVAPAVAGTNKIITTLQRLISTRTVRDALGLELRRGVLYSSYPGPEIYKGLRKIVNDLRTGDIKVTDVYYEDDRSKYIDDFLPIDLPDPSTRLPEAIALNELSVVAEVSTAEEPSVKSGATVDGSSPASGPDVSGPAVGSTVDVTKGASGSNGSLVRPKETDGTEKSTPANPTPSNTTPGSARISRPRSFTIPRTCNLKVTNARIKGIYHELLKLDVEEYANACAVLLRVFVELSVDEYLIRESVMTEDERRNTALAKRMKSAAEHMRTAGKIGEQLEKSVIKVTEGKSPFSISTTTLNQYVHNPYVFPRPSEIRTCWDELQPFIQQIWVR
ncbi:hypothetical protein [Kutzneria kofuensis]|uniref:ParB/Sulfiredoxin domain-containing protein n=1 Tax=Kutzneria kofuensis TaxID=103725 RepID=A0A7W9KIH5_9PSEU|nr:hypothetical protein [Kutzneria kofuensis]MBB5893191.1 hypothetical protein [Kutzneria kofuensis]